MRGKRRISEEQEKRLVAITYDILTTLQNYKLDIEQTEFVLWSGLGLVMQKTLSAFSRQTFGEIKVDECRYTAVRSMTEELLVVLNTIDAGLRREKAIDDSNNKAKK